MKKPCLSSISPVYISTGTPCTGKYCNVTKITSQLLQDPSRVWVYAKFLAKSLQDALKVNVKYTNKQTDKDIYIEKKQTNKREN